MTIVNLKKYPWHTTTFLAGRYSYSITIFPVRKLMYAIIEDGDGNRIAGPIRCCSRRWMIPFLARNYSGAGNFVFVTKGDNYPHFLDFGDDCELRYYSKEEIDGESIS